MIDWIDCMGAFIAGLIAGWLTLSAIAVCLAGKDDKD